MSSDSHSEFGVEGSQDIEDLISDTEHLTNLIGSIQREEEGISYDSHAQKRAYIDQQKQIASAFDASDRENLSKHLHIAWQLNRNYRTKSHDLHDELQSRIEDRAAAIEAGAEENTSQSTNGEELPLGAIIDKHRNFKPSRRWTAWPIPSRLLRVKETTYNKTTSVKLRDELFGYLLNQAKIKLRNRPEKYSVSSDEYFSEILCQPILQETIRKFEQLLCSVYRGRQGFVGFCKESTERSYSYKVPDDTSELNVVAEQREAAKKRRKVYKKSIKNTNSMDATDVINHANLQGWPTEVVHAAVARLAKIFPSSQYTDVRNEGYYILSEAAKLEKIAPKRWVGPSQVKQKPILGKGVLQIGDQRHHFNTVEVYKKEEALNALKAKGGGVSNDGFLENIEGIRPRKGGNHYQRIVKRKNNVKDLRNNLAKMAKTNN